MNRAEAIFFNELLLASSESSSEDEELQTRGPMSKVNSIKITYSEPLFTNAVVPRPRITNYIELVVNAYSEGEFRENFRMYRTTFDHCVTLLEEQISSDITDSGRHTIPAKAQLLIALWYFGTPDSFRSICGRFNVGKATALRTVRRVANALINLAPSIIVWPSGQYLEEVKHGFHQMGFPNTIGAVDGSYIRIPQPKEHGLSYICRKNYPCIILQGICDHNLKFSHCYTGEVGSTHDAMVLKRSDVWGFINNRIEEKFPGDTHLIGDKAYPCLPQLIPPYKNNGHLTRQQRNFNYQLSCARSSIERAFNLLKKRFRCLKDLLDVQRVDWIPKYIMACCVLHNICIMQNDILEVEVQEDIPDEEEDDIIPGMDRERLRLGTAKRDRLCQLLNN